MSNVRCNIELQLLTSALLEKDMEITRLSRPYAHQQHLLESINAKTNEVHLNSLKDRLASANVMLDVGAIKTFHG